MHKLRITISIDDDTPEGTGLLAALGLLVRDVQTIVDNSGTSKRWSASSYNDDFGMMVSATWSKARKDERLPEPKQAAEFDRAAEFERRWQQALNNKRNKRNKR